MYWLNAVDSNSQKRVWISTSPVNWFRKLLISISKAMFNLRVMTQITVTVTSCDYSTLQPTISRKLLTLHVCSLLPLLCISNLHFWALISFDISLFFSLPNIHSIRTSMIRELTHCCLATECGGCHLKANILLAAVRPAQRMCLCSKDKTKRVVVQRAS